jgi:hypothetical protein
MMSNWRFKRLDRKWREARMVARGLKSGTHPILAQIVPIRRCNLACAYCNEYDAVSPPKPTEDMLKRIDHLARLGTANVQLSGGEPMLHPDLDVIIRRIRQQGRTASDRSRRRLSKRCCRLTMARAGAHLGASDCCGRCSSRVATATGSAPLLGSYWGREHPGRIIPISAAAFTTGAPRTVRHLVRWPLLGDVRASTSHRPLSNFERA